MVTYGNKTYCLDEHGYLEHPSMWDDNFAEGIAPKLGAASGLSDDHWRVINYLRQKLDDEDTVPFFVTTCRELGFKLGKFRSLFPTGFMRGACRAAGLSFRYIAERNMILTYENLPSVWERYTIGPMGFLESFDQWDQAFSNLVAREWDLPAGLTEVHWKVIRYLRERYGETGAIPLVYETCRANNLTIEGLNTLFPAGYRRGACRIAGLPIDA